MPNQSRKETCHTYARTPTEADTCRIDLSFLLSVSLFPRFFLLRAQDISAIATICTRMGRLVLASHLSARVNFSQFRAIRTIEVPYYLACLPQDSAFLLNAPHQLNFKSIPSPKY